MPAKKLQRTDEEGAYYHIYNKGIEARTIFNDEKDYEVFQGFLKDYLTPANPEGTKKVFTVNGRIFQGVPHQPKNYLNKIELIAYSLMPNYFHLVLRQLTKGSLESFIRSLCTRYSMYFNKKYNRTGTLFEGPYKSAQINGATPLLLLTHYLHQHSDHSSYKEYLGERITSWIKPKIVLSFFEKSKNDAFKGVDGYKNFVEKYEPSKKENEALERIILERKSGHLERTIPELAGSNPHLKAARIPEFTGAIAVFLLLVTLGVRNIRASTNQSSKPSPTPIVSGAEDIKPEPKTMLTIKISDGSESVNIRQQPSTQSEKIGVAFEGETFEFVSINSGWYEVKLEGDSTGFISERYVEIQETNN